MKGSAKRGERRCSLVSQAAVALIILAVCHGPVRHGGFAASGHGAVGGLGHGGVRHHRVRPGVRRVRNDTLMMVAGMLVIGQAVCETGVVDRMGGVLERLASLGERSSIALVSLVAGVLSAFMSNTAIVASTLPVSIRLPSRAGGARFAGGWPMPVGAAAILGGNLTLVGSTPQLVAQGILEGAGGAGAWLLHLAQRWASAVRHRHCLLCHGRTPAAKGRVGRFRAARRPAARCEGDRCARSVARKRPSSRWRRSPHAFVGFVTGVWTVGAVALAGALFLIATRCIDLQSVVRNVDWSAVIILGGSLGFSAGLEGREPACSLRMPSSASAAGRAASPARHLRGRW